MIKRSRGRATIGMQITAPDEVVERKTERGGACKKQHKKQSGSHLGTTRVTLQRRDEFWYKEYRLEKEEVLRRRPSPKNESITKKADSERKGGLILKAQADWAGQGKARINLRLSECPIKRKKGKDSACKRGRVPADQGTGNGEHNRERGREAKKRGKTEKESSFSVCTSLKKGKRVIFTMKVLGKREPQMEDGTRRGMKLKEKSSECQRFGRRPLA